MASYFEAISMALLIFALLLIIGYSNNMAKKKSDPTPHISVVNETSLSFFEKIILTTPRLPVLNGKARNYGWNT